MSDWYCSSAAFAAVSAFVASHAYSVGDFVKENAHAACMKYFWRFTTAGTSSTEPTWSSAYLDGATITSGGATFTNVAGRSTYGWTAAAGTLQALVTTAAYRPNAGDRVFLSSDHSESGAGTNYGSGCNNGNDAFGVIQYISVNRAGSVPPVAADITNGAAITTTSAMTLDARTNFFWQGITFTGASNTSIGFNSSCCKAHVFKNCAIVLQGNGSLVNGNSVKV